MHPVEIDQALSTGQLTTGSFGNEFKERFATHVDTKYAVAVNSDTSSLEIAMRILGVQGKMVQELTNSFCATPVAILHTGDKVCFIDADPATFALDAENLMRGIMVG